MRLATGTIASLVLTVGALLLLVTVGSSDNVINSGRRPPKSSYLRSNPSRNLYNYSRSSSGSYGGNYASSSATTDDAGGDDDASASASSSTSSSASSYNSYNSNQNNQADGSNYNGRDQQYSGQSIQTYTDDEEPEVDVETYAEVDRWSLLKVGALSGSETLAVVGLATMVSLSMIFLFMLASGFNVIHLIQLYCNCCGAFGHTDEKEGEVIEEGFVKLDDC
jgi:hypothetical protein